MSEVALPAVKSARPTHYELRAIFGTYDDSPLICSTYIDTLSIPDELPPAQRNTLMLSRLNHAYLVMVEMMKEKGLTP